MGGLCSCSRSRSSASKSEVNTDGKFKDETKERMLENDGNSLNVGDKVTFATLNKSDKHKPVKRAPQETKHQSKIQKEFDRVSGIDDSGNHHNNITNSKHSKRNNENDADNDENSCSDDEDYGSNSNSNLDPKSKSNSQLGNEPLFLPVSSETLVVSRGGFSMTNGEYRWNFSSKSWCFFTETGTHYVIEGNIKVEKVYEQLERLKSKNAHFRWSDDITHCWAISDMSGEHIYYAAPTQFSDNIPSNFGWISVHGSEPGPILTQNKLHDSQFPENDEDSLTFGSMSSLMGRHPSSRVSNNIETLAEEDDANIPQETPPNDSIPEEDEDDEDDESEISSMEK